MVTRAMMIPHFGARFLGLRMGSGDYGSPTSDTGCADSVVDNDGDGYYDHIDCDDEDAWLSGLLSEFNHLCS